MQRRHQILKGAPSHLRVVDPLQFPKLSDYSTPAKTFCYRHLGTGELKQEYEKRCLQIHVARIFNTGSLSTRIDLNGVYNPYILAPGLNTVFTQHSCVGVTFSKDYLLKPGQNKKGQKIFQLHRFLNTFLQLAAEKKYSYLSNKRAYTLNYFGLFSTLHALYCMPARLIIFQSFSTLHTKYILI